MVIIDGTQLKKDTKVYFMMIFDTREIRVDLHKCHRINMHKCWGYNKYETKILLLMIVMLIMCHGRVSLEPREELHLLQKRS
jgi:hypothetical protein